jgi:hypothetical protein
VSSVNVRNGVKTGKAHYEHMFSALPLTGGPEKFRSAVKEDFFNTICQEQTLRMQITKKSL